MKYKFIYYNKTTKYFTYRQCYKDITITRSFKNIKNALCYKFIQELKLKTSIFNLNKSII